MRRHMNMGPGMMGRFFGGRSLVGNLLIIAILGAVLYFVWNSHLKRAYKIILTIIIVLLFLAIFTSPWGSRFMMPGGY